MKIKQDPVTGLWCREDGAVLKPPCRRYPKHRWVLGCPGDKCGHLVVGFCGKRYSVHRLIAGAFVPNPDGLPTVDHIDRNPKNNRVANLRWATYKMQADNTENVFRGIAAYGVRYCEDSKAYHKAHDAAYRAAYSAKMKAKGLVYRKSRDGKWRWINPKEAECQP